MSAGEILRQVVPPLVTVWVLIVAMLVSAARERREEERPWPPRGSSALTLVVGFGVFLAYVAVFQTLATGDETALPSALAGGGALLGVAVGGFAILSAIRRVRRDG